MAKASSKEKGNILVIVESPTKAKTIRKFLGKQYQVQSCFGHIRDLPQSAKDIPEKYKKEEWSKLGVNVDKDFEPLYCIPKDKTKVVNELKSLLKDADQLILATDEDREGESISWHLLEVLKPKIPYKRMVFHEITKEAIEESLENTRDIDFNLVKAQESRRILDRLVGYTISPLLWKKIAFGLSAGRVQSVAVRLICEREKERMKFKKSDYWSLLAHSDKLGISIEAKLLETKGKRVATGKDFDPDTGELFADKKNQTIALNESAAKKIQDSLKGQKLTVVSVEEKPITRKPYPPFITSTLQQESSRKLGLGASQTMRVAQSLYEQGYITYMRTDSTNLSQQALKAARDGIKELYGKDYLPDEPRFYAGKKVKGAQEAHEAIRPAGTHFVLPEASGLKGDEFRLYDLIWKRTVASQMTDSKQKQVSVRLSSGDNLFSASGTTIEFAGFLRAYVEGSDDPEAALEERDVQLPPLKVNEQLAIKKTDVQSHETKPPARYTEASLIQTMEKVGIGRPSTYAATIATVMNRGYVQKLNSALAPTFTAMVVNKLLEEHLPKYVDVDFTSKMEESLDEIAAGDLDYLDYLKKLYLGKDGLKKSVEAQDKMIKPETARAIEIESLKGLSVRVGRFGAYVCRPKGKDEEVCASLPDSQPPADVTAEIANQLIDQKEKGVDALGKDPKSGEPIYVLNGRYGPYIQLGDAQDDKKVKRTSLPATLKPEDVTLDKALFLLSLPRTLGVHPGTKKDIKLGIGRFGPYVVHDGDFRSVSKSENFFEVSFEKAMELLNKPKAGRGRAAPIKELGTHPNNKEPVAVYNGKYGPYVKWGKKNVSLPEGTTPESMTLELALGLLGTVPSKGAKKGVKVKKEDLLKVKKVVKKKAAKAVQKRA